MKKILSILLVLSLICCLFVGCTEGDSHSNSSQVESKPITDQEKAVQTAETFIKALFEHDLEAVKACFAESEQLDEIWLDIVKIEDDVFELVGGMENATAEVEKMIQVLIKLQKDNTSHKILSVEKQDDSYLVKAEIATLDYYANTQLEIQRIISGISTEENVLKIYQELYEEGKITESTSSAEIMDLLTAEVYKLATEAIKDYEFTTVYLTVDLVIFEKDGKWLIDGEKGDFSYRYK